MYYSNNTPAIINALTALNDKIDVMILSQEHEAKIFKLVNDYPSRLNLHYPSKRKAPVFINDLLFDYTTMFYGKQDIKEDMINRYLEYFVTNETKSTLDLNLYNRLKGTRKDLKVRLYELTHILTKLKQSLTIGFYCSYGPDKKYELTDDRSLNTYYSNVCVMTWSLDLPGLPKTIMYLYPYQNKGISLITLEDSFTCVDWKSELPKDIIYPLFLERGMTILDTLSTMISVAGNGEMLARLCMNNKEVLDIMKSRFLDILLSLIDRDLYLKSIYTFVLQCDEFKQIYLDNLEIIKVNIELKGKERQLIYHFNLINN